MKKLGLLPSPCSKNLVICSRNKVLARTKEFHRRTPWEHTGVDPEILKIGGNLCWLTRLADEEHFRF